jgi:hypothetical protein
LPTVAWSETELFWTAGSKTADSTVATLFRTSPSATPHATRATTPNVAVDRGAIESAWHSSPCPAPVHVHPVGLTWLSSVVPAGS